MVRYLRKSARRSDVRKFLIWYMAMEILTLSWSVQGQEPWKEVSEPGLLESIGQGIRSIFYNIIPSVFKQDENDLNDDEPPSPLPFQLFERLPPWQENGPPTTQTSDNYHAPSDFVHHQLPSQLPPPPFLTLQPPPPLVPKNGRNFVNTPPFKRPQEITHSRQVKRVVVKQVGKWIVEKRLPGLQVPVQQVAAGSIFVNKKVPAPPQIKQQTQWPPSTSTITTITTSQPVAPNENGTVVTVNLNHVDHVFKFNFEAKKLNPSGESNHNVYQQFYAKVKSTPPSAIFV